MIKQREQKHARYLKKMKKRQKKKRLINKRKKKYTCKRYKNKIKFDSNIKFHEHIRERHAKKLKTIVISTFESFIFISIFVKNIISIILFISFSPFISLVSYSIALFISPTTLSQKTLNVLRMSLSSTSKKSIFWAAIVSRPIVASKFFRFSRLIFNAAIVYSFISFFISPQIFALIAKFYITMNDLYRMFTDKNSKISLLNNQIRNFFSFAFNNSNSRTFVNFFIR